MMDWRADFPLVTVALSAGKALFRRLLPFAAVILLAWLAVIVLFALVRTVQQLLRELGHDKKTRAAFRIKKPVVFFNALIDGVVASVPKLPRIAFAALVFCALNAVFVFAQDLIDFVSAQKRIKELTAVVKNLSRADDIARIRVLEDSAGTAAGRTVKRYAIEVLALDGSILSEQEVELEGEELWLDSVNLNFDYAEIGSGRQMNIAYPYRVYSEKIPAKDGVPLTCMYDDEQVPILFLLTQDEVYGITKEAYAARLMDFVFIIRDERAMKEMGIRSFIGNAIHVRAAKGDEFIVRVEATGGLSLRSSRF